MCNICEDLQKFFKEKKLTQNEIAEIMGVSNTYINAILCGRKRIGRSSAMKMQDLFGLSSSWLLTGEGDMMRNNITQTVTGDHNQIAAGDQHNNIHIDNQKTISKDSEIVGKLLEALDKERNQNDKLIEQNAQLIKLLAAQMEK